MVNKNFSRRLAFCSLLIFIFTLIPTLSANAYPVSYTGQEYDRFLDGLDVTNKWLANRIVDWKSGKSLSRYAKAGTHCSTFVAAAATKLGIDFLTPARGPGLLANAQFDWLHKKGAQHGWAAVNNHLLAQKIANQGCFVVVAYANPNRHRPGHVAIVRPSNKPLSEIYSRGPQIIQAGRQNFNSTSLSSAFRHHQAAFNRHRIVYYAHSTAYCQLLTSKEQGGHSSLKRL